MPIKLRGRSKYKDPVSETGNNCLKSGQKSKTLIWRLFSSRRSVDNCSPAVRSVDAVPCSFDGSSILEEEYQEASFGSSPAATAVVMEHSESVPSILRKLSEQLTPQQAMVTPARIAARHSAYAHRFPSAHTTTNGEAGGGSIYNEPCDAKRAGGEAGGGAGSGVSKKASTRRASLAASIYCDTEHHRPTLGATPQGSPDSIQLSSSDRATNEGLRSGVSNHTTPQYCRNHDSGSSSLSNSRDASVSCNGPHFGMASPPVGSSSSTRHSPHHSRPIGGSMRVHSQSPPPASSSASSSTSHTAQLTSAAPAKVTPAGHGQALLRDNRQRQQQHQPGGQAAPGSPGVERLRNLSPWRQQQQQQQKQQDSGHAPPPPPASHGDSPSVSNTSSFSNCMVVLKGNTQISHHPASPFAPPASARTSTPGGEAATAAVAKGSDVEEDDEGAYDRVFCASTAVMTNGISGRNGPENITPGETGAGVTVSPVNGNSNGHVVRSSRRGRRGGKDLVATYEEAWDVKMSRRLGGMDVSRLASSPQPNGGTPNMGDVVSRAALGGASPPPLLNGESGGGVGGRSAFQRSAAIRTSERQLRSTGTDDVWDASGLLRRGASSPLADAGGLSPFHRATAVHASYRPLRSTGDTAAVIKRSPSLSPVLTSTTEGVVMRRRPGIPGVVGRQPMPAPRNLNLRNSSNETVINREMMTSPFRLKQNRVASPPCKSSVSPSHLEQAPASPTTSESAVTDYDYAYNRSWSMGVQLNLSLNLANTNGTTDEDSPADHCVSKPASPRILAAPSPVAPPPPPHRSQSQSKTSPPPSTLPSVMTPTTTQFSPPQSPTPAMRLHRGTTANSPPPLARNRGVHNPMATGVPLGVSSEGEEVEEEEAVGDRDDATTASSNGGGSGDGAAVPGLLPHMSRLLVDWDIVSTDSCEEPWDVKHGKVISQLTSSRFIDPSEVLSAVASGSHNGTTAITTATGTTSQSGEPEKTCYRTPLPNSSSEVKVSHVNCLKPLSEQPWFHPNLTRSGAEKRLRSEPEGSFLVRNSETTKNEYSLTVKHNGFLHMRITRDPQGQFVLGEYSQPYPSIPHMISHYEQTQVPVRGADSVTLCYPR